MHGMKRAYESLLSEYLRIFPCVALIGPRQSGKTTLLHTLPNDWHHFDLESSSDYSVIADDPDLFLRLNSDKIAIDEAQMLPSLFSALRVAVDADRTRKGRFVITGSSSPDLLRSISESLAGRIGIIEISPFMWAEVNQGSVSALVTGIANTNTNTNTSTKTPQSIMEHLTPRTESIEEVFDYWFRGGYPEPWLENDRRFSDRWADQYVATYLQRDIARLFPRLNPERFRLFLRMLGGLSGQVINYANIARAIGISQPTARDYFEIAHGTFLWRRIPAYSANSTKRIVKHPKGYIRDPGLLHFLLRVPDITSLQTHPQAGASWEGMVIEEIIRQLNCLGVSFDYYFYRTAAGGEVDLILEGAFGTIPIEIKLGQNVNQRNLKSIRNFIKEYKCPYGVVISNDIKPRLYDEKLLGVPFAFL
jgi:predicted AAA+ superfamily ATPase